jgi:hypothetical protein
MNSRQSLIALVAALTSLGAWASITANLDRDHIAPGETVRLTLQRDGSGGQPDISPLRADFNILGTSSGSSMQFINGQASSHTSLEVMLAPKHAGTLAIPPLKWDTQSSPALTLQVDGKAADGTQGQGTAADASHIFITETVDQRQPYVQSATLLTVRLFTDQPLYQATLDLPANSDVQVRQLGKDSQHSETRNGRTYQVIERRYLLLPQRSGKVSLPGAVLDGQVQVQDERMASPFANDPFFAHAFDNLPMPGMLSSLRPVHLQGNPLPLDVQPRPAAASDKIWLPAQRVKLDETWPQGATLHVGEPITRHLHLEALGLTGDQLPDLSTLLALPDGVKAYPDQAKTSDQAEGGTVLGSRDQDIALIASRPGPLVFPAVQLAWWDTVNKVEHQISLPSHTVNILPATAATTAATAALPAASAGSDSHAVASESGSATESVGSKNWQHAPIWFWLAGAFALLWVASTLAWWRGRHRQPRPGAMMPADSPTPASPSASAAKAAFRQACASHDAPAARQHLLAWARATWPDQPPNGLNALARRIGDNPLLTEALQALDRACYQGGEWHGEALQQLELASPQPARTGRKEPVLADLYP